jgi:vacuolar protein sorting-associated protein 54
MPPPAAAVAPSAGGLGGAAGGGSGNDKANSLSAAAELSHRSISELLRIRKDVHAGISLVEIKQLWDSILAFTLEVRPTSPLCSAPPARSLTHAQVETYNMGVRAWGLRSTLLAQAKGFIERKHETHMKQLVSTLDSEKWSQCDMSAMRQASVDRLCSGRAAAGGETGAPGVGAGATETPVNVVNMAMVDGREFRVCWSALLLVQVSGRSERAKRASEACERSERRKGVGRVGAAGC